MKETKSFASQDQAKPSTDAGLCYAPVMKGEGFSLGIVKDGETGYYVTDYPIVETYEGACEWANHQNKRLGLSEKDADMMIARSMRKH